MLLRYGPILYCNEPATEKFSERMLDKLAMFWPELLFGINSLGFSMKQLGDRDGLGESLYLAVLNKFAATKAGTPTPCQPMFLCPLSLPTHPTNDPHLHDQSNWEHSVGGYLHFQPTESKKR